MQSLIYPVLPKLSRKMIKQFMGSEFEAEWNNNDWFNFHYLQLLNLKLSVLKFENINTYIPIDIPAKILAFNRYLVYAKDDEFGEQIYQINGIYNWDMYGNPLTFTVKPFSFSTLTNRTGKGAYPTKVFTDGVDAVVIRGTATELLPIQKIFKYSELLTLAMKQQTVNIKNQETQKIFAVDENTELNATETNKQFQGGASTIITYKKNDSNSKLSEKYKQQSTTQDSEKPLWEYNVPAIFISDKLQEQYEDWWASALTSLGIPNVAVRKKERLNVAETLSNQDEVNLNSDMDYQLIKQGFDRVNELFGRNIQVSRNGMLMNNEILELGANEESDEVITDEPTDIE